MKIKTEADITPKSVRALREQMKMTQKEFWESVGSSQASGHWFECGKRKGISRPLRYLIFLMYVAKLNFDLTNPDEADAAIRMGNELAAKREALRLEREAAAATARAKQASEAAKHIKL
jgi:transcriptional regulator with XRE-family HTH domain